MITLPVCSNDPRLLLLRHDPLLDLVRGRLGVDLSGLLLTGISTMMRHVEQGFY